MRFGKSKVEWSLRALAVRPRKGGKRSRSRLGARILRAPLLGAEMLEPRQLLAAANVAQAPNFTVQEQALLTNQLVAIINDQAATVADYTATIKWGDGTTSDGTVVSTQQSGVFQVLGSHQYADVGTDTVRVLVSKDGGAPSTVVETATVTDAPLGPASGGYTIYATQGQAPADQPVALFTDPAPEFALPLSSPPTPRPGAYTATINWGDGTATAGTISYLPALSQFQVSGGSDHIYTTYGTQAVTVTISHGSVPSVTVTDTAIIYDPPVVAQGGLTFTGNEGAAPPAQTLATFTDPGGNFPLNHYSATIDWGDGNTTAGTVASAGGQLSVRGTHQYVEEGTGAVYVTIVKDGNSTVTAISSYNIADPPVQLSGTSLATTEGALLSAAVATFIDPGGAEDVGDYSAQINWGDQTVSPGTITLSAANGVYTVFGSHVYQGAGIKQINVTVQHDVAPNATVMSRIAISDVPLVGTAGPTFTATEGSLSTNQVVATFTDPGVILQPISAPGAYGATIDWGDGSAPSAGTISLNSGSQIFTVSAQHLYAEEGTYPLSITLSHDQASDVTLNGTAAVADPPVVAIGGATYTALEFRTSTPQIMAAFTDPGGGESLNNYSATINWGDGTASGGQIISDITNTRFSVLGAHIYNAFGTYTPTVTIHHDQAPDVTVTDTAVVGVPPFQLSALPTAWREWTVPVELSPLARITFTDNQMTSTISWGDGGTSAGVITPDLLGSSGTVRGSHIYTETGNYTINITVNDGPQTVTQAIPITVLRELLPLPNPSAATSTNYYVAELYGDILRRPVDGGGLVYWSKLLDQGVPRSAVTAAMVKSPEYLGNFVINPDYLKYLGRPADPAGLQFWIAQMQHGLTDEALVASFASSPEFYSNAGGGTQGYVDALYQKVLGRPADPAGENFWTNQLNAGASRYAVALQFETSGENFSDVVFSDYEALLQRTPSLDELNAAVNGLAHGTMTNEGLLASIAASDEYFALSQSE